MRNQFTRHEWNGYRNLGPDLLHFMLEGTLSKAEVQRARKFTGTAHQKTWAYIDTLLTGATDEQLRQLVFYMTGSNSMPTDSALNTDSNSLAKDSALNFFIYIGSNSERDAFPRAHTYFRQLDVPNNFPDQKTFNERLAIAIKVGSDGFQMA